MKKFIFCFMVLVVCFAGSGCCSRTGCASAVNPCDVELGVHSAVTPASRASNWWMPRHEGVLKRIAEGNVNIIHIGDSITHGWNNAGKATWNEYYAPRGAVNMGFSGDRTQHVLWRLDNGEIDGINPKLAVIMIGTNNSGGQSNTAEEIADGIKAIVCELRTELPRTKILILSIFPRGATPSAQRTKNALASEIASGMADGKMIYYLDINNQFLQADGTLTREVMPDLLHPKEKGYAIWAEAVEPTISKLMGE